VLHYDKPIRFPLSREINMIKFFRLSKHYFATQNQTSGRCLVEIAACGKDRTTKYD
jgi:hypothetical protein